MSLMISILGTILSFAIINNYYMLLQTLVNHNELPDLTVIFDIKTFLLSVSIVPVIVGTSAYYHSRKELKKNDTVKQKKFSTTVVKLLFWGVSIGLWLLCFKILISDTAGKSMSDIIQQTGTVLFLLLIHLFLIQLMSPKAQMVLLNWISKVIPSNNYALVVGKWNILFNPTYLKNLQVSVTMGITLVSGFLLYVQNIYIGNYSDGAKEAVFSFVTYLSAPILIILANTISITILSSNQDKKELSQLKVLGASNKNLIMIKFAEAFLHSLIIFVISFLFNLIILFAVNYSANLLGNHMTSINNVWLPDLVLSGIVCLFYLGTKLLSIGSYESQSWY